MYINDNVELHYSSDDEENIGKGWYFQLYHTDKPSDPVSQSFASKDDAIAARRDGNIVWE